MAKNVAGPSTGASSQSNNSSNNIDEIIKYNAAMPTNDPNDVWNNLLKQTSDFYASPWSKVSMGLGGFEQNPDTLTFANMNPSNGKFGSNPFIQGNGQISVGGILSGVGSFANGFTNAFTNALGGNTAGLLDAKLKGNEYKNTQTEKKQTMTDKYIQQLQTSGVAPALDTWDKARAAYNTNAGKDIDTSDPAADKTLGIEFARTALNPTQRAMTDSDALQAFESYATKAAKAIGEVFDNKTNAMGPKLRDQMMDSIMGNTNPYIKQGMGLKASNDAVGVPTSYQPLDQFQMPTNGRYIRSQNIDDGTYGQMIINPKFVDNSGSADNTKGTPVNFGYKDMDSKDAYKQAQSYQYMDARTHQLIPLSSMVTEYAKAANINPDISKWTPEMKQQFFKDITGAAIANANGTTPTNNNPAFTAPAGAK